MARVNPPSAADLRAAHTRCRVRFIDCPAEYDAAMASPLYSRVILLEAKAAMALRFSEKRAQIIDFKRRASGERDE